MLEALSVVQILLVLKIILKLDYQRSKHNSSILERQCRTLPEPFSSIESSWVGLAWYYHDRSFLGHNCQLLGDCRMTVKTCFQPLPHEGTSSISSAFAIFKTKTVDRLRVDVDLV